MLLRDRKFGFNLGALSAVVLAGGVLAPYGGGTATEVATEVSLEGNVRLVGAGASFPAPLYQRWFQEFSNAQSQIQVDYQSVGSGAGVEQFTKETVDFGASDVAMDDDEIEAVDRGVLLLPMTAGSIVLAYNLDGVESLNLTRDAYLGIMLGKITQWNDPVIADANPGVELPDSAIAFVHRSDGSGTTGVFTKHLSAISPEWEQKVGAGKTVEWPVGTGA
ncbi:MAG: phosphate ABC transporter substrate-binding protein PstS, partial [Cyanobacteria bacterium J06641_5]